MSELQERIDFLEKENKQAKLALEKAFEYFEKWDTIADKPTEPKEEPKVDIYEKFKKELDLNDQLLNRKTNTPQPQTVNPMFQNLMNELNENKELLNNK